MAAVLRSATRRLAGHLPELERGHIHLPGASFDPLKGHCSAHSGFTSHCSPQTAALHGGAFRPARIAPSCNRVGSMRTRMFSTPAGGSARPPQDKFDICIRGGKMATLSEPNPKTYNMWVTRKNVADSHIEFWRFVRRVKNNDAVSEIKEQLRTEWQKVQLHPWLQKINRHYWLYFVYLSFVYVQVWCEIVGLKLPNNCEELGDAPADPFDLPCLFDEMF